MIRAWSVAVLVAALAALAESSARAELPVAPPPREVRPDGSRDPAPPPEPPAKAEDPAAVVDRIIKNSKDVGDKLARTDTGTGTRQTQDKILSDIDALINRQENPPPPQPNDNKDQKDQNKGKSQQPDNKDKKDKKDQPKDNDPMNKDGMPPPKGDMPKEDTPKGDMGMGAKQDGMPTGGMNDPHPMGGQGNTGGRRPRMGEKDQKKTPEQPEQKPDPKEQKKGGQPKAGDDAKNPGVVAGGTPGGKAKAGMPSLPFSEDVAKDVWGHLPDRLRRQMTQYYKEDVMPKYAELLRLYYSSLSDKSPGPGVPRR